MDAEIKWGLIVIAAIFCLAVVSDTIVKVTKTLHPCDCTHQRVTCTASPSAEVE